MEEIFLCYVAIRIIPGLLADIFKNTCSFRRKLLFLHRFSREYAWRFSVVA